jgi:insertion element IS1 protein InsB
MDPREIIIAIHKVEAVGVDEMWSFVGKKTQQRWLWHASDHRTGMVSAHVLGTHQDGVFVQLKALLTPSGIRHFYTDGADVYDRHLEPQHHTVGQAHTQKIERKHLIFRTRLKCLVRKTICFSKSMLLHRYRHWVICQWR